MADFYSSINSQPYDREAFLTQSIAALKKGEPLPTHPEVVWSDPKAVTVEMLEQTLTDLNKAKADSGSQLFAYSARKYDEAVAAGLDPKKLSPDYFLPEGYSRPQVIPGLEWDPNSGDTDSPVDRLIESKDPLLNGGNVLSQATAVPFTTTVSKAAPVQPDLLTGTVGNIDREAFLMQSIAALKKGEPLPTNSEVVWSDPKAVTVEMLEQTLTDLNKAKADPGSQLFAYSARKYDEAVAAGLDPKKLSPDYFLPEGYSRPQVIPGLEWNPNSGDTDSPVDRLIESMGGAEVKSITVPSDIAKGGLFDLINYVQSLNSNSI